MQIALGLLAIVCAVLVGLFVRERRRARQLAASEARYRSIVQEASCGIYRSDSRGILFANPALVRMLGYSSQEELLAADLKDIYKNPDIRRQLVEQVTRDGEARDIELEWKRKDGSPLLVRASTRAVRDGDGSVIFEGVVEDISSRQALEDQLRRTEKLASIGRFVAGAAHEINNPLTAIMGYAELLATDSTLPEEQRGFAEKIRQQARRTKSITQNLQSFSSQKPEERKQLLELNAVVSNAMRIAEMNSTTLKIKFQQELDPNLPRVFGDEYQLLEISMHILNNAVDSLKETGSGRISVRTRAEGDWAVLEFEDTGRGFEDPGRIFDPFYTTKPVGEGAGLGLSASYGIVKAHGGKIEARNRGEGGAVITIRLPAASAAQVAQAMAAAGLRR